MNPDQSVADVMALMREKKIRRVPVVEKGKDQVGIIADLGAATKEYDVNIGSLAVFHREDNQVQILVHLQGDKVSEVETAIKKLGYNIKD